MVHHNVDVSRVAAYADAVRADSSRGRRTLSVEGNWNVAGGPQLTANIRFEGGVLTANADQPTFQGGGGRAPNPMLYCLFGLASCYAATLATLAAGEGVELSGLHVKAEAGVDHSRALGLSSRAPIERVALTVIVQTTADGKTVERLRREACERCPAVYCLTNPIPLEISVKGA